MYGIGKDTAIRDAIGVTVAIVAAILLFGVVEMMPVPGAPAQPEPAVAQETVWEVQDATNAVAPDASPAEPAPYGRS